MEGKKNLKLQFKIHIGVFIDLPVISGLQLNDRIHSYYGHSPTPPVSWGVNPTIFPNIIPPLYDVLPQSNRKLVC